MPINSLTIDPKNPAFKDAIMGCKEGDEVTLEVTGKVVSMGNNYVLDVSKVESTAEENAESPEEESKETDEGDSDSGEEMGDGTGEPMADGKPMPGKNKGTGVMVLIGGKGPK